MDPQHPQRPGPFGEIRRRSLVRAAVGTAALGTVAALAGTVDSEASAGPDTGEPTDEDTSYRGEYHFTVPDEWMNDPQRPLLVEGTYLYYYLYNADYTSDGSGTAWRLATTRDHVAYEDQGVAIDKDGPGGDVWSGSAVLDVDNTAGLGAGAVLVLATQQPEGSGHTQAQYLWYSTDHGRSFTRHGSEPVLPNPGTEDFRDPKVVRDAERDRWVLLLAEGQKVGFYTSENLREWTYASGFTRTDLGVLECPDLFRIETSDGTARWVLGVSANGRDAGLPHTYAYWIGEFDGETFDAQDDQPRWLDYGFDWYAAVTWEQYNDREAGTVDPTVRLALAWMNSWDYPDTTPTVEHDGFNGTDSVTRALTLVPEGSGYALASRPTAALDDHVTRTHQLGDRTVDGESRLAYQGTAYELTATVRWEAQPETLGVQLRRSSDGERHVDVGVHGDQAFVNRGNTENPDGSGELLESHSPFEASAQAVRLRVLVDRTTVEAFFDDGTYVHSHQVFPPPDDLDLALFTVGGTATFEDVTVREFT